MSGSGSAAAEPAAPPLDAAGFAHLMAAVGPFERTPTIAVAVSGGPDSLALALLADRWARGRHGRVIALTVDHGLRSESADEAAQVGRWLGARAIDHHVLAWRGAPRVGTAVPAGNLQARARAARHDLLGAWCAASGVLHLLLAHHLDDQAETFLLRLGRGSGVDGLGAMAPVSYTPSCRVLRPLLDVPKARLVATCHAFGQAFVSDPSNRNPAFARVRLREALPALGADGLAAERLARTASAMRRARAALDQSTTELLVRAAQPHPGGVCKLTRGLLVGAPRELALRALAAVLGCVGGAVYRPRLERLERLLDALGAGATAAPGPRAVARTLGGCRVAARGDTIWVAREAAAMAPPVALFADRAVAWDGRFVVYAADPLPPGASVGGLGAAGLAALKAAAPALDRGGVPALGLPGLPAVRDLDGVLVVPHLNYCREGRRTDTIARLLILPEPASALAGAGPLAEPGWIDGGR